MRTLRTRLLLSHTLPLVIIIMIVGITLDYVLETRILLPGFAQELTHEAKLLAEIVENQPDIWASPTTAQAYLDRLEPILEPLVSLFDDQGRLIATTNPSAGGQTSSVFDFEGQSPDVFADDIYIKTQYNSNLEANVVDVQIPVIRPDGQVIGAIRMTYHLENVYKQFLNLRYVLTGILAGGVLLGLVLATLLALNMGGLLQRLTQSVRNLADGKEYDAPLEQGPEEIRSLLREVNSLVERLRTIENSRRKMLANLVHELGRPLGALVLAVQAMQQGARQDEALHQELLAGMEKEMDILRRHLDDLTQLHDQLLGVMELKTQTVEINNWLPILIRTQQEAAKVKELRWQVSMSDKLPMIEADPDRLAQAVGNLINNAVKFTPPGGEISLDTGTQGNEVWIRISDTGPGIPKNEQVHIFTPFYRGHSENRFPQGMGLGLSIARDLVDAQQGRLEFTSVLGEGSSFTIWLPCSSVQN